MTNHELLEQSFNIAWDVLTKTGDVGHTEGAASFLVDKIQNMMRRGEKRRLLLSNAAIDAYRNRQQACPLVS
jgi:hypothetical protein